MSTTNLVHNQRAPQKDHRPRKARKHRRWSSPATILSLIVLAAVVAAVPMLVICKVYVAGTPMTKLLGVALNMCRYMGDEYGYA